MKQGYLFRLFLFATALLGYLYLFDPSFTKFIHSAHEVMDLNIDDKHLLNSIVWILGFYGILAYLNSSQKIFRVSAWFVFISASLINFLHIQMMGDVFAIGSVEKISLMIGNIGSVDFSELMKFLFFSIALLGVAIVIKPLSINIGKYLSITLLILVISIMLIFKGKNIALQSAYLVPGIIVYHYVLVGFGFITEYMHSNSIAPKVK